MRLIGLRLLILAGIFGFVVVTTERLNSEDALGNSTDSDEISLADG